MYDPSISVHKGYNLSKEAEQFLISHGLKNASYSISVNDVKDNLFGKLGKLVACPYQVCIYRVSRDFQDVFSSIEHERGVQHRVLA